MGTAALGCPPGEARVCTEHLECGVDRFPPRVFLTRRMTFSSRHRVLRTFLVAMGAIACVASFLVYNNRVEHPVLYYYGASPEVPGGTAIPILNPFRNRKDEGNAEWLIRDLRSNKCEQVVSERLRADPKQVCMVMRNNTKARLIWLETELDSQPPRGSRELVYDLPKNKARLIVYFRTDEAGWGVSTVSILR